MVFLVDLENVGSEGLRGAGELLEEDVVIIFYSQTCEQVQQGYVRQIMEAYCCWEICRLKKTGKNALDFYIATKLGEIIGRGYPGKIAVVSKDQGFKSVREYWRSRAKPPREVILGGTLEQCILSAQEGRARTMQIKERLRPVRLETEFVRYQERMRIRESLEMAFADTGYQEQLGKIQGIFEKQSGKKILYLDTIKNFGKKDGLAIYRKMRTLIG